MELSISDLYFKVINFDGEDKFESILKKWVLENDYKSYLSKLSNNIQTEKANLSQEEIWELYALNRVLDILTLKFQTSNSSISDYIEFIKLVELDISIPKSFNTFDCEIIEAQAGEVDFLISECFFPAVKLKNLMIKRAGIKILLNPANFNLTSINNAFVYWTFRRNNRKCFDLSQDLSNFPLEPTSKKLI